VDKAQTAAVPSAAFQHFDKIGAKPFAATALAASSEKGLSRIVVQPDGPFPREQLRFNNARMRHLGSDRIAKPQKGFTLRRSGGGGR
jgi:hypothetical protein